LEVVHVTVHTGMSVGHCHASYKEGLENGDMGILFKECAQL